MAEINKGENAVAIENMVRKVLEQIAVGGNAPATSGLSGFTGANGENGIFTDMEEAIAAAHKAQQEYALYPMRRRDDFIEAIRDMVRRPDILRKLSEDAVAETGMGNVDDKMQKNKLVADKTPGTEDLITDAFSGDDGLSIVELSPYGVIGAITPTTNPTETVLCNSIGMLAAGNSVVFSPHPRAKNVSVFLVSELNKALAALDAPPNLIVTVAEPSIKSTEAMMNHKLVRMLVATGGPEIVRTVMSTGKKAIGAGAGNPPVVVDETAIIEKAAMDIIAGCSFDNNLPCIAEKEVFAVEHIADYLIFNMKKFGAYQVTDENDLERLKKLVLNDKGHAETSCIGKSAQYLLGKIGVKADPSVKAVIIDCGFDHPFVQEELMMPILPIVRVSDVDSAIDLAVKAEHGFRHTAIMHSQNVSNLTNMAKRSQTTIFVKNGPSFAGIGVGGEGYTTFTIAGPTGEGLTSARSFARRRRCVLVDGFNIR